MPAHADTILYNGKITTNDRSNPEAQAVALARTFYFANA